MSAKESGYHVSNKKWDDIVTETLSESYVSSSNDMLWAIDSHRKLVLANDAYLDFIYSMTGTRLHVDDDALTPDANNASMDKWDYFYSRALTGEQFHIITAFASQKKSVLVDANFIPLTNGTETLGTICLARNTSSMIMPRTDGQNDGTENDSFISRS
jgi:hypothetical protein